MHRSNDEERRGHFHLRVELCTRLELTRVPYDPVKSSPVDLGSVEKSRALYSFVEYSQGRCVHIGELGPRMYSI